MTKVTEITNCRGCGGDMFTPILNLGNQYIVDFVKTKLDAKRGRAPLELILCNSCQLPQLRHSVEAEAMFRQYWYRSGTNEKMVRDLESIVQQAARRVKLNTGDGVLDIGANDCTLLSFYPNSTRRTAVDPAGAKFMLPACEGNLCDAYIKDFFKLEQHEGKKYSVITAVAMFYDLEDPGQFLKDLKEVLHPEGEIIIQQNYLLSMLQNCAVDNISHEHLTYFSLMAMKPLIKAAGLRIADVEKNDVNGGSFRVYLRHAEYKGEIKVSGGSVKDTDQEELVGQQHVKAFEQAEDCLHSLAPFAKFVEKWEETKDLLIRFVIKHKIADLPVYAYGASTRGNTILQALDLPEGSIVACAERASEKFGLMMVGSWIPIISEEEARAKCRNFFVLPYHFGKAIVERELSWMSQGGRLLFPLPTPTVVHAVGSNVKHYQLTKNG